MPERTQARAVMVARRGRHDRRAAAGRPRSSASWRRRSRSPRMRATAPPVAGQDRAHDGRGPGARACSRPSAPRSTSSAIFPASRPRRPSSCGCVAHTKARVCCTRKTTPGLRALEKYAVRCGGGFNHRFGLDDAILIKDNHIAVAGGIRAVLERARAAAGHLVKIEIEVDTLEQLRRGARRRPRRRRAARQHGAADDMRRAVGIGRRPARHRSLRRHHARHGSRDRRDRRRLSLFRRDHPFGRRISTSRSTSRCSRQGIGRPGRPRLGEGGEIGTPRRPRARSGVPSTLRF